ncbi:MAG: hypothetical protein ACOX75_07285 [Lachnospiraceae bacterium]|jgi:hypothetical protein
MGKASRFVIFAAIVCLFTGLIGVPAFADGGIYAYEYEIWMGYGETRYVTIGATNAAGRVDISSDAPAFAGGSDFLDNSEMTVEIYAGDYGTGYVYVTATDMATFDDEDISGAGFTITVHVPVPEPEPDNWNDGGWDGGGGDGGEEADTEPAPEEIPDNLRTKVEGRSMVVVQSFDIEDPKGESIEGERPTIRNPVLESLPELKGFKESKTDYNGEQVSIFESGEGLQVFVLKDEDGKAGYYVLKDGPDSFMPLIQEFFDSRTVICIDMPEGTPVPGGWELKSIKLKGGNVMAICPTEESDFAIIYCVVDGTGALYSYDAVEGTIQRLNPKLVEEKKSQESSPPETESESGEGIEIIEKNKWQALPGQTKGMLIGLGAAIVALIISIILLIRKK